jgi:hypothetical protein
LSWPNPNVSNVYNIGFVGIKLTFNSRKEGYFKMEDIDSDGAKECVHCKRKIAEETKFCPECGKPQEGAPISSLLKKKRLLFKGHGPNQIQKIILALLIPILMFFITYKIAFEIDASLGTGKLNLNLWDDYSKRLNDSARLKLPLPEEPHLLRPDPFNYDTTWFVWCGAIILTGVIELLLFRSRKKVLSGTVSL